MRAAFLVLGIGIAVAGCAKPEPTPQDLEADYKFIAAHNGSQAEKCEAAKKVQAAYLKTKDNFNYDLWHSTVFRICNGYLES